MFIPEERLIYRWFDGHRDRVADPLAIEATYFDAISTLNVRGLNQQLKSEIRQARVHASEQLLPAIRETFGVREFDEATGEGMPLADTHDLLRAFFRWRGDVRRRDRTDARISGVYGYLGRPVGYEFYCGLAFNLEEVAAIQAVQTARGIGAVLTGSPHGSLLAAMAEHESQIVGIADEVAAEQMRAEEEAHIQGGRR